MLGVIFSLILWAILFFILFSLSVYLVSRLWPLIFLIPLGLVLFSAFTQAVNFWMSEYQLTDFGWAIVSVISGIIIFGGIGLWFCGLIYYVIWKPLVSLVEKIEGD
jgi:hypothetical protein